MKFYNTPYLFVGNKMTSTEDKEFITEQLGETPSAFLMDNAGVKRNPSEVVAEWQDALARVYTAVTRAARHDRFERTVEKFKRNQEFTHE